MVVVVVVVVVEREVEVMVVVVEGEEVREGWEEVVVVEAVEEVVGVGPKPRFPPLFGPHSP